MMKKLLLVLFLFCASGAISQNKVMNADETACKTTVVDFYKWYKANSKKMNAFILYKGKKKKNMPPYIIDWKAVDKYFAFVRKSVPYMGEAFINHEKKFFQDTQKEFDADPDGEVPAGFDYDRFDGSQEDPTYIVDHTILYPKNKWEVKINGNKATVFITDMHKDAGAQKSKVGLTKENGVWKISECLDAIEK
jgi:hypothetical protein